MSARKPGVFPRSISKDQAKDTGMAFVLICLLLTFFLDNLLYAKIAVALLVVDMVAPNFFKYPAYLWLGLSHLIGSVVSRILLSLIFFIIVTPVGLFRRLFRFDSLMLKRFKKNNKSVMVERNKVFIREDLERPY